MEKDDNLLQASKIGIWQRGPGNKLENIYEVLLAIMKNLEFYDLLNCRKVCSLWKEVAEEAMKIRIFIVEEKIEFSILRKSILQPEVILPYLKLEGIENVQFVSEYPSYLPSDFISASQNGLPVSLERIEKNTFDYFMKEDFEIYSMDNISVSCEILTQTAIFPSVPGVEIHRFAYTSQEIHECLSNGKLNLAEKINVPQDELKCVLWFFGDISETHILGLLRIPENLFPAGKYAMGGVDRFCMTELNRGIAFCGNRIKGVSLKLCRNLHPGYSLDAEHSLDSILRSRRFEIDQKKCIGFLFLAYDYKLGCILTVLKRYFPDVPIFRRYCFWPFGIEYIPNRDDSWKDEENNPSLQSDKCPNNRHSRCATLVLVWFD